MNPQDILSKLGGLGALGMQDGGPVDDDGNGPSMLGGPRDDVPPPPRGFDPYRHMERPAPGSYAAAQQSPWMAALAAGLGILGKSGARDAHGLPIPGAAAIGQGAQAGFDVMKQQQEQEQKQREVALRARQLEAEWAQHQAQLRLQTGQALGMVNNQPTVAAQQLQETIRHNTQPQYHSIQNEWGAQTPAVFDPRTGTMKAIPNMPSADGAAAGAGNTGAAYAMPTNLDWTKTGPDFIAQLPPQWSKELETIAHGRAAMPSTSSRDPRAKIIAAMLPIAYPGFDASQWRANNATATAFAAGGKEAQKIASAGMLIGHLDTLDKMVDKLGNWDWVPPIARSIGNPVASQIGWQATKEALNNFEAQRHLVGDEKTKLLAGVSGGTLEDRQKNAAAFDPKLGGTTLHSAIRETIGQMEARLLETANQWNTIHPNDKKNPRDFIAPEHRKVLEELEARLAGKEQSAGLHLPKPVAQMSLEEMDKLPPQKLSKQQLEEVIARRRALRTGGP